jgi:dolichol-phosphate mannosyltransferase
MPESSRYVRGMFHWLGFRQIGIPYVRLGRTGGKSKVDLTYLVGFTLNAVFNFSVKPLRMFSALGLATLALTFAWTGVAATRALFGSQSAGIGLVPLLLLLNLGIMSLGIGILGEYIARIFVEGKHRPLWLVDYTLNLQPRALRRVSGGVSSRNRGAPRRRPLARSTNSIGSSGVA